jgi:PQQ-dependent dehydrogenase (methanol/ethanol family)
MKRRWFFEIALFWTICIGMPSAQWGCSRGTAQTAVPAVAPSSRVSEDPDDGTWRTPAKDDANTRFSGLAEISRENVARLQPRFTFSTGVLRGHESAPLVFGSTMYILTPYPNLLYALDLTQPGAPVKWTYRPSPSSSSQGAACCDVVNRGAIYAGGSIFFNTLDGHTVAVNANTGKERWKVKLADFNLGETLTMAPFVAKNKVLVGNSGGEFGVRGWLAALDAATGKIQWKAYSTGPDSEVLIGPQFKPFYAQDRGKDLGVTTWPAGAWKTGGGTVWGFISFDPELNLIYYGTANPGPWNPEQRPGDNKWTSGIFARDADTGQARWYYQFSPHDTFDYDGVNENVLLNLQIGGAARKVLAHPDRNGYVYILDRVTGEVLSAQAYGYINTSTGVDLKSGRLLYAAEKAPRVGVVVRDVCPAAPGAKDWNPSAYSPQTGLLYIPHQNICEEIEATQANYISGTPFVGANIIMTAGPGGHRGLVTAWDPVAGKKVWQITERFPVYSGALATAGGLVFYGTMDGWFKALDATNGKQLWQYKVGSGIIGQPSSYRGPDGKQYVAILAGVGGWPGAVVSGDLDMRDRTADTGWANAMADLPQATTKGGTLYVFSLP